MPAVTIYNHTSWDYQNIRIRTEDGLYQTIIIKSGNNSGKLLISNVSCPKLAEGTFFFIGSAYYSDNTSTSSVSIPITTSNNIHIYDSCLVMLYRNNASVGSVSGQGHYIKNRTATIKAFSNPGYNFIGWWDYNNQSYLISSSSEYSFKVTKNVSYLAKFEKKNKAIYFKAGAGISSVNPTSILAQYGSQVTCTATIQNPNQYSAARWISNTGSIVNPDGAGYTKLVLPSIGDNTATSWTAEATLEVKYKLDCQVNPKNSGTVSYNPDNSNHEYSYNSKVTLEAKPNKGYKFIQWSDSTTSTSKQITVNDNITLEATFEAITYNVKLNVNGGLWEDNTVDDKNAFEDNSSKKTWGTSENIIKDTPKADDTHKRGYEFKGWSVKKDYNEQIEDKNNWITPSKYSNYNDDSYLTSKYQSITDKTSVTLYAVWVPIEKDIILNYYIDNKHLERQEKTYNITKSNYVYDDDDIKDESNWGDNTAFLGWVAWAESDQRVEVWNENKGKFNSLVDIPKDWKYNNNYIINTRNITQEQWENKEVINIYALWISTGKYFKINDSWKKINGAWVKVDNKWKPINTWYFKKDGKWKKEVN